MSIRHGPDDGAATEIAHSSTIQVENCTARDRARVQYGNTYVQNQYNGHNAGSQQLSGNTNQRIDFVEALAFDEMDSRYESIDPAHVNTCQWLFQKLEYLQWRDREHLASHNGFLWIKGKAGSGKSTLMKCAFEHAEENFPHDEIISFFFNARGQHLERSVEGMYRSLLSQILRHFPQLRPKFPTHCPISFQQQGWAVAVLRNHVHRAISNLGQGDAITIYIDALDECEEEDIREAIELFEELGLVALSMPIALYICFASRYYPQVTIQHCVEIHLEEQIEHQQDIKKYINGKLAIRDIMFKAQLASEIEARASGVFLWVVLVIRLVKRRCDGGASHSEISKSLQEVPDKLQELIGAILQSPDDPLLCTLRWILFAERPLKLQELYFAIRTGTGQLTSGIRDPAEINDDGMESYILASSRGLVEMKSGWMGNIQAQLVHESVREYLIAGGLEELGSCSNKMVEVHNHAKLFQWCQTYLGSITEDYVATSENGYSRRGVLDVRRTYPLLSYAGDFILSHFEVAYIAGVLRSSSLHEFPIRQCIYPDFLDKDISPGVCRQLLEPDRLFTSLLYVSILRKRVQLAEALLAENAVHSARLNNRGCTNATASNSGFSAAKMFANEIDLNLHFEGSKSSLLELAIDCCPDAVRHLLDHGADVNIDGGAPLCRAVELYVVGDGMDLVLLLLTHGAQAQVYQTSSEMTALALAVMNGSLAIVMSLLEHGADANGARGTQAISPLLAALGHGDSREEGWLRGIYPVKEDILHALLDHGADVYLKAGPGQVSPIEFARTLRTHHTAKYRDSDIDIVRLLTSHGQRTRREVRRADLSLDPRCSRDEQSGTTMNSDFTRRLAEWEHSCHVRAERESESKTKSSHIMRRKT
jgi:energy-coupling factor transporter ATP-binding protein EcfA2